MTLGAQFESARRDTLLVHSSILRGMDQILKHVDIVPEGDQKDFFQYVWCFGSFLHLHHHHEEQIAKEANPSKESFEQIKALTTKIKGFCEPHFKQEEDTLFNTTFCSEMKDEHFKIMNKRILSAVQKDPPTYTFTYLIFHLEESEKGGFAAMLPWFVRVLFFPYWARAYEHSWKKFAFNPSTTPKGKLVFLK